MNSRNMMIALLAGLLFVGLPLSSSSKEDGVTIVISSTPDVLKGVKGVYVMVEGKTKDAEEDGLSKDDIQTDVELKLRQSGIHVNSEKENRDSRGCILYVDVNLMKIKAEPIYVYNLQVSLLECLPLPQKPKTLCAGVAVWQKGQYGIVKVSVLHNVRDGVKDLADMFCNDYLKANPKN